MRKLLCCAAATLLAGCFRPGGRCDRDDQCGPGRACRDSACVTVGGADGGGADGGKDGGTADAGRDAGPDASVPCGGACPAGKLCNGATCVLAMDGVTLGPPASGAYVSGSTPVSVVVQMTTDGGLTPPLVTLHTDGGNLWGVPVPNLASGGVGYEYSASLDTAPLGEGPSRLTARAWLTVGDGGIEALSGPVDIVVDNTPPLIASLGLECLVGDGGTHDGACARDDKVAVKVVVTEANPASASVTFGQAAPLPVPFVSGQTFQTVVDLATLPYPHFDDPMAVTASATDRAGNSTPNSTSASLGVTRVRWRSTAAGLHSVTEAAIDDAAQAIYLASDDHRVWAVSARDGATLGTRVDIGGAAQTQPPALGPGGLFLPNDAHQLLYLPITGGAFGTLLGPPVCPGFVAPPFAAALRPDAAGEIAFFPQIGTATPYLFTAQLLSTPALSCAPYASPGIKTLSAAVVLGASDVWTAERILAGGGQDELVHYLFNGVTFTGTTGITVGGAGPGVSSLAVGTGPVLYYGTIAPGVASPLLASVNATTGVPAPVGGALPDAPGPIVASSTGHLFVGLGNRTVIEVDPTSGNIQSTWALPGTGVKEVAGLLLPPPGGPVVAYATARNGFLSALGPGGTIVWSKALEPNASLQPPNVASSATGSAPFTLVVPTSGLDAGAVWGIVLDSGLDTAAPWPKEHHDVANSRNFTHSLP